VLTQNDVNGIVEQFASTLRSRMTESLSADVARMQTAMVKVENEMKELNAEKSRLQTEIDGLKRQKAAYETALTAYKAELAK